MIIIYIKWRKVHEVYRMENPKMMNRVIYDEKLLVIST